MTPGRGEPAQPAAGLFQIAGLVEAGLPAPRLVSVHGRDVMVMLTVEDVPRWVIELDLPAPDWLIVEAGDKLCRYATWPLGAFDSLLFRIEAIDEVPVLPEQECEAGYVGPLPDLPASAYDPGAELLLPFDEIRAALS